MEFRIPQGMQAVQGIPIGRLANLETRVSRLESSGGSTFYTETPSGTIDGSNKVFTVLHSINTILSFSFSGTYIHPSEYSFGSSTITFVTAPDVSLSGLPFTIVYS